MSIPIQARTNMVERQVRPNRVSDERVISALSSVPRENFLPGALKSVAYLDEEIEVAPGRFVIEPMVLARLLQVAGVGADDVALDIGCASGYSTAVLAHLAGTVVALEEDERLAGKAGQVLTAMEIGNAAVVSGPLGAGYPGEGPYDVILIAGRIGVLPDQVTDQLAEGGRLVTVMEIGSVGKAVLVTRNQGVVGRRIIFDAWVPPMPGFEKRAGFDF